MAIMDASAASPWQRSAVLGDSLMAPLLTAGAPVIAASGAPLRPIFASASAAALFEADTLDLIEERLFSPEAPIGARLARLAAALAPNAPPRLERLRLVIGRQSETVTLICRNIVLADGRRLFVLAIPTVRPGLLRPLPRARDLVAAGEPDERGQSMETRAAPAEASVGLAGGTLADVPRSAGAEKRRFLWQTDRNHILSVLSGDFDEIVGQASADLIGRRLPEALGQRGVDPEGRLAAALAHCETFGPIALEWPRPDRTAKVPIELFGVPVFGEARDFLGFRGFGLITIDAQGAPSDDPDRAEPMGAAASGLSAPEGDRGAMAAPPRISPAPPPRQPSEGDDHKVVPLRPHDAVQRPAAGRPVALRAAAAGEAASTAGEMPLVTRLADLRAWRGEAAEASPRGGARTETSKAGQPTPVGPGGTVLSPGERHAFREIARALGAGLDGQGGGPSASEGERGASSDVEGADHVPDGPVAPPIGAARSAGPPAPPSAEPRYDLARNAAAILERAPIGILVARGEAPVYLNRTLLDLLGHEDLAAFAAAGGIAGMFEGRGPSTLDMGGAIAIRTRAGERMSVDARVQAIDWDGAPATLISFRRALDEEASSRLRALERELREREAEALDLRAILDAAADGVVVLDGDGRIGSVNRSATARLGLAHEGIAGSLFTALLATESHMAALEYFAALRRGGATAAPREGIEVLGNARQGGPIPLFMTIGRLPAGDGPRFCLVLRDLAAWKKVEHELDTARRQAERASQLKSDFLARVSHEIRTPLNAILGFAEVIIDERFGPIGNERYKDYIRDIHASGSHVMSLVNDLLDLSKIEAGKMDLSFAWIDANKVVAECVALMQPEATRERVIIRTALTPRLPLVLADERSLRQITLNLLSNAMKFNEPGGQVIVSTGAADNGQIALRIRDTGPGMSEADIETALEPFRQLPTTHRKMGTGLGLPLTRALVEANRASFNIKSRKNEGTLVEVVFPAAAVMEAAG